MGEVSVAHWLVLGLIVPCLLPLVLRPPAGPNRFGPPPQPVSFTAAVQSAYAKFFSFAGRASRSEFWYFYLFQFLVGLVAQVAMQIAPEIALAVLVLNVGIVLPFIALTARRLHDRNRSGWWQLLVLTGIGGIVLLVWMMRPPKEST